MKLVLQRVSQAKVTVKNKIVGQIGTGLMILVGVGKDDVEEDLSYLVDKVVNLRIFNDTDGKMNLSILQVKGEILSVSQFTLLASTRKGRRPGFTDAAFPEKGEQLYKRFNELLQEKGVNIQTGIFGADMQVELVNYGPVTIILDSRDRFLPRK